MTFIVAEKPEIGVIIGSIFQQKSLGILEILVSEKVIKMKREIVDRDGDFERNDFNCSFNCKVGKPSDKAKTRVTGVAGCCGSTALNTNGLEAGHDLLSVKFEFDTDERVVVVGEINCLKK